MSHQPERKEKNCLNCGATVIGHYCHVCGQENIETKESFWSLAKHFVFDIFHFDGKFFHTLKYIFVKPGLVAREYCLGKRMSFLHPIRMYLFTSAIFFLVFASVNHVNFGDGDKSKILSTADRMELVQDYKERLMKTPGDSSLSNIIALLADTSKEITGNQIVMMDPKPFFTVTGRNYKTLAEYDSAQNVLPTNQRDSWFKHMLTKKAIAFNEKYKGRPGEASKIFWESFLHRLPYMLFLSLPFFALILKLLYARRKNFYYSDHAIFTIYHYILSFILLLAMFCISTLAEKTGWSIFSYLVSAVLFFWPLYLLFEMKNFYQQRWSKTIGKFLLLNVLGSIVILILFAGFLLFSVFEL